MAIRIAKNQIEVKEIPHLLNNTITFVKGTGKVSCALFSHL